MTSQEPRFFKKEARKVHKGTKLLITLAVLAVFTLLAVGQAMAMPSMSPDKVTCTPCHNDGRKGDGKGGVLQAAPAKSEQAAPAKTEAKAPAKAAPAPAPAPAAKVSVKAFGKTTTLDGKAAGKAVLVPLRGAANAFFASLNWDAKTKTATIKYNGKTAAITLNKDKATVDGKDVALDAKAQLVKGQTYVPAGFVAAAFSSELSGDLSQGFAVNAALPGYVGSDTCAKCHQGTYANWQGTRHSRMVQDAKAADTWFISDFRTNTFFKKDDVAFTVGNGLEGGQRYVSSVDGQLMYMTATWNAENRTWNKANPSKYTCGGCHNTGYNPKSGSWAENSITCEACHGPGAEHAKTADKTKIKVSLNSQEMCGSCHGGERQVGQMQETGHNNFFATMLETNPSYSDRCVKCHSATAFTANRRGQPLPTLADFKTGALKNDRDGITCSVCHAPHKNTGNPNQLRKPLTETCTQCHTNDSAPVAGKVPHHPQKEMFEGTGIGLTVPNPKNVTCVDCHMTDGNHKWKAGTPTVTLIDHGKPYEANSCESCHATMTAAELKEKQEATLSQAEAYEAQLVDIKVKLDAAIAAGKGVTEAQALYDANVTNVGLLIEDKSKGVHNPAFAKAILAKAGADLATLLP